MKINIPYGKKQVGVSIHEKNLLGILHPNRSHSRKPESRIIKEAILHPMGCCRLRDLVSPKETIAIVVPDLARVCPRKLIIPILLDELKKGGIRDKDVTIFMAVGMLTPPTRPEIEEAFGKKIVKRIKIKIHDPSDSSNLTNLGYVANGVPVIVNKHMLYNDHVISIGVIEPHLHAGFSGGPETLSIGMAGEETIRFTHSPKFIDKPGAKPGVIKDNPFHRWIMEFACIAKLKFIINVVNDDLGRTIFATAGEPQLAFYRGIEHAMLHYRVKVDEPADIIICGVGWPKDVNLYQASRALTYLTNTQKPIVKKGGLILISARCEDGIGKGLGERRFYDAMIKAKSPAEIVKKMKNKTCLAGEQRAYAVAKSLLFADCAFVGTKFPDMAKKMKMLSFKDMDEALEYAFATRGKDAKVYVVPHALVTLPVSR
ncbi:MAG: nickel-dependent lactate racemase [Candidatus Omnitrophota bacterium]|jgi:nickel-dependent lactate racemase